MKRTNSFDFTSRPAAPETEGIIAILIGLAADPEPGAGAYFQPGFSGGVVVAAGDVDGASLAELLGEEPIYY